VAPEALSCLGLVVIPEFVTRDHEDAVVSLLDANKSAPGRDRNRILRYGSGVRASHYTSGVVFADIPGELEAIGDLLIAQGLVDHHQNAITINEYLPGQGLGFHTDAEQAGGVVSIVGLVADAQIAFRRWDIPGVHELTFARRSLVQISGPCRWNPWQHAILPVTERRISIVYRCA
jgi:alkylated DNA repair dioxygenase AlkB